MAKTTQISRLFSEVHDQLSATEQPQINRAGVFLRLLEINKKVEQLFDQSEVGFGGNTFNLPMIPSGPGNGEKAENLSGDPSKPGQFGKFRDQLMGLNARSRKNKFMDMHDVVDMHSDKALPDFLHKLNLRLNLYEPDLKFATISKK